LVPHHGGQDPVTNASPQSRQTNNTLEIHSHDLLEPLASEFLLKVIVKNNRYGMKAGGTSFDISISSFTVRPKGSLTGVANIFASPAGFLS